MKRLEQSRLEEIAETYREHPLLQACMSAYRMFQARMSYLMFSPVEVFVESAVVIDCLFESGTDIDAYVSKLWEELTIKYKLWQTGTPEEEIQTAVSSVFYTVAVALSVCDDNYYKDVVKEALLNEVYAHKSVVKQEEDMIIVKLASFADKLKNWVNVYLDSDRYLSDEILSARTRKLPLKPLKTTKKYNKNSEENTTSFNYNPAKIDDSSRNIRLSEVFTRMKSNRLIATDTDLRHFLELFSGESTFVKIVWTGKMNILHYIFDQWINREYLPKPKGGVWSVVAARFKFRDKDDHGDDTDRPLNNDEVRKAGNPKNPSQNIEDIIEMLKPDIRARRFND